jgi:dTDP-4-dehydrorhamnose 3,5-epimerase-like enzyme
MKPNLITGNQFKDQRGTLFFNNDFDLTNIKRIYVIENKNEDIVRAWQGHKIEQRWFSVIEGKFRIQLIEVDNWDKPSKNLPKIEFILKSENLDVLHVPPGFISCIQSLDKKSKLIAFTDYKLGEINDEFRYPTNYFTI